MANHSQSGKPQENDVDEQIQKVLVLLSDRQKGKASNDEVEKAVSSILSTAGLGPPSQGAKRQPTKQAEPRKPVAAPEPSPEVQLDEDNYDDDDEEEEEQEEDNKKNDEKPAPTIRTPAKRGRPKKHRSKAELAAEERMRQYEKIPLGRQGAHMLTAFGDGPFPRYETVTAALLGARKLLQVTIQDARALRRQAKQQFKKAQYEVAKGKQRQIVTDGAEAIPDPEMLYRAYIGYDKMQRETKCGFNFEQLKSLFPEEMRAYARWNQLKDEYQNKSDEPADEEGNADDDKDKEEDDQNPLQEGGHLEERAVQFDLRTTLMDQCGYMKFSEHRKGSFLPKRIRQQGDMEWKEKRKNAKRNRGSSNKDAGIWSQMSAKSARFLHWVGFDPDKGLPPPNDETTQALAFLGYDFVGRIIEKAIFLKNLAKARENNKEVDETTILLELEKGEQLEKTDIDNAMKDIRPAAMYSTKTSVVASQQPTAQLYFGPGFEDRVEMELEQMLAQDGKEAGVISEEEAKIRKQEDKLFSEMAKPPTTNNAVMLLMGKEEDDDDDDEAEAVNVDSPKSPRNKRHKKSSD